MSDEPYTEYTGKYSPKLRKVYCQNCKYEIEVNIPGPKCGKCHDFLIEIVKHNELAGQDS